MDINFIISYIIIPIIYSFFLFRKHDTPKKRIALNSMYFTKSVYFYFLAVSTIVSILKNSEYIQESLAGLAISFAIMDGSEAFKQACDQRKEIIIEQRMNLLKDKYEK